MFRRTLITCNRKTSIGFYSRPTSIVQPIGNDFCFVFSQLVRSKRQQTNNQSNKQLNNYISILNNI
jgi:hypothetical protein